jgi:hypothetical protein
MSKWTLKDQWIKERRLAEYLSYSEYISRVHIPSPYPESISRVHIPGPYPESISRVHIPSPYPEYISRVFTPPLPSPSPSSLSLTQYLCIRALVYYKRPLIKMEIQEQGWQENEPYPEAP